MNITTSGSVMLNYKERSFAIAITAMLIPIIVIGNLFVMTAYKTNVRLRTRTYTFLLSLAVSDIIVGGVNLPMWIWCMVNYRECASPTYMLVFKFLDRFGAFASIFHLTAISVERYIAVVKPYLFCQLPKRFFLLVSALAWVSAILLASLSWLGNSHTASYNLAVFLIGFVLPASIVISMYIGILNAAKSLNKRTPYFTNGKSKNNISQDRKVAITVAVISGLFIVAWLPFFVLSIIASYCHGNKCFPSNKEDVLRMVTAVKWLHYSNSGVNPIVYALRDKEMKKSFKKIIKDLFSWRDFEYRSSVRSQSTGSSLTKREIVYL